MHSVEGLEEPPDEPPEFDMHHEEEEEEEGDDGSTVTTVSTDVDRMASDHVEHDDGRALHYFVVEPQEIGGDDDGDNDGATVVGDDPEDMLVNDDDDSVCDDAFVEFDPTRRYGRYAEILGKGAMKTVYRAFDFVDCKEVAWSKARNPMDGPEEQILAVQREILLLQKLHHKSVIKLYSAWVEDSSGCTNFVSELCASTLLAFRLKHKQISRKAIQSWGRQILEGLVHIHSQNPPIIHRDLKCENILLKCSSSASLKIADFGSATLLDRSCPMHAVGTPEFMAPEMFEEDYNELVDIYSFGMCMLQLLTSEFPYSECSSLVEIYKKVSSGQKPQALYKLKDMQAIHFINRCLLPASKRPSASLLLADPFLHSKPSGPSFSMSFHNSLSMPNLGNQTGCLKERTSFEQCASSVNQSNKCTLMAANPKEHDTTTVQRSNVVSGKVICSKSPSFKRTYFVTGKLEDRNTLHLNLRIQRSSASCDIDFPFDLRYDSPSSVAEEMIKAFDYPESDLNMISNLIREEVLSFGVNLNKCGSVNACGSPEVPPMWLKHHGTQQSSKCTSQLLLDSQHDEVVDLLEVGEQNANKR